MEHRWIKQYGTDEGPKFFPTLSSALAELIAGEHDISQLTTREKAAFLFGLQKAAETTQSIGWIEHTSDWDWWVGFYLTDGSYIGDDDGIHPNEDDETNRAYADEFTVNFTKDEFRFEPTDDEWFDKLEVTVKYFSDSPEPDFTKTVKISQIAKVTYAER